MPFRRYMMVTSSPQGVLFVEIGLLALARDGAGTEGNQERRLWLRVQPR